MPFTTLGKLDVGIVRFSRPARKIQAILSKSREHAVRLITSLGYRTSITFNSSMRVQAQLGQYTDRSQRAPLRPFRRHL